MMGSEIEKQKGVSKMIIASAIQFYIDKTNEIVIMCGLRHGDIFKQLKLLGFEPNKGYKCISQGFITNTGKYLNRKEALEHALQCNQISKIHNTELFSEDLW